MEYVPIMTNWVGKLPFEHWLIKKLECYKMLSYKHEFKSLHLFFKFDKHKHNFFKETFFMKPRHQIFWGSWKNAPFLGSNFRWYIKNASPRKNITLEWLSRQSLNFVVCLENSFTISELRECFWWKWHRLKIKNVENLPGQVHNNRRVSPRNHFR